MKKASKKTVWAIVFSTAAVLALALVFGFMKGQEVAVLNPKGVIAASQRDLIITGTLLMLLIVVPVFALTFAFAWKYRAANTKATYSPDLDHSRILEFTWWAIPSGIIVVLAVITWRSTYQLHPTVPIKSDKPTLTVQVVALQWKWLFIYPDLGVASLNEVKIPEDTPIKFVITSDAPMNSFWIPQLGGQIYAMAGMTRTLHLMANEQGTYRGVSANISGRGFADMKFKAVAQNQQAFTQWVSSARNSSLNQLDERQYKMIAMPSTVDSPAAYRLADDKLYNKIIAKYMAPGTMGGTHGY